MNGWLFSFRRRRGREARLQAVIAGLNGLKVEFPDPLDHRYINDMLLYAEVGRDRYSLDESWVESTRTHLETHLRRTLA